MTGLEKDIYNTYLKISRTKQNKPFKFRLNFEGFEEKEEYIYIKKLSIFFEKYKHIKIEDFFSAPYVVYPASNNSYDLKFYSGYNATKVYSLYQKKLLSLNPDDEMVLEKTKEGVKFIIKFCKENNIKLNQYFSHMNEKMNSFWVHLKDNQINVYCLFLTEHLYQIYNKSDKDVINLMLDNLMLNINMYRTVFYSSVKTKKIITEIKQHFSY
jgi:hypothetical protein